MFSKRNRLKNFWEGCISMSETTLQQEINARKSIFLQQLKEYGIYLDYCSKRGYVYEIVQRISGCMTRIVVSLKDGLLSVLSMNETNA